MLTDLPHRELLAGCQLAPCARLPACLLTELGKQALQVTGLILQSSFMHVLLMAHSWQAHSRLAHRSWGSRTRSCSP